MKKRFLVNIVMFGLIVCTAGCGSIEAAELTGLNANSTETVSTDLSGGSLEAEEAITENSDNNNSVSESAVTEAESMSMEGQQTEYTYSEGTELMLVVGQSSKADEKDRIDVNAMSLLQTYTHVTIPKEMDIYFSDGTLAGYAKVGANPVWISSDDKWCSLAFTDGTYFVKKDEFYEALEENSSSSEEMSASVAENIPETEAYTINDLEKLMFVQKSVNVRSGPGAGYGKVGSLAVNQEVAVTGQADNGWYRFSYNGEEAFVSDKYLADNKVAVEVAAVSSSKSGETPATEQGSGSPNMPPVAEVSQPVSVEPEQKAEVQPTPEPETPATVYTEAEVISIVRSTLEAAGAQWYPDSDEYQHYLQHPELYQGLEVGPDGGMGWGIANIPMDDPYSAAESMLEGFLFSSVKYYYIESLGVSNGRVKLKVYSAS